MRNWLISTIYGCFSAEYILRLWKHLLVIIVLINGSHMYTVCYSGSGSGGGGGGIVAVVGDKRGGLTMTRITAVAKPIQEMLMVLNKKSRRNPLYHGWEEIYKAFFS